jgi:DNA-binding transcriptional ArsR family regulator
LPKRPNSRPRSTAPLFAALGDGLRLRLISRLSTSGPLSIRELTAGSQITRQAVTKHLRMMEQAGLLRHQRRGREQLWHLNRRRLKEARRYLRTISRQWDEALGRLREFVENGS